MLSPIETIKQVKRLIFKHPFSFPGSYTHACYLSDGSRICRDCLLDNWASVVEQTLHKFGEWQILGIDIYWEGPDEYCVQCNKVMPSEYGDPSVGENSENI